MLDLAGGSGFPAFPLAREFPDAHITLTGAECPQCYLGAQADSGKGDNPLDATAGVTHCGRLCAWTLHDEYMPWTYAVHSMEKQRVGWMP